ncbi:MAG: mechanosensitive ion channel family protein [Rhizobiaceae bacterium]
MFQKVGDWLVSWHASLNLNAQVLSVVAVLLVFLFRRIFSSWITKVVSKFLKQFGVRLADNVVVQLNKATEILLVLLSLYFCLQLLNPDTIIELFATQIISSIAIVAVFGTWFQLCGNFVSFLRNEAFKRVDVETDWVKRITQFAIVLFGITSLLKVWHVDISGALTGVGVLGAGLAIAAQDLVRNLMAGMSNMSEKRFKTGDTIRVDGKFMGSVRRIDLRSTLVVGFDQIPRHIPNSDLSDSIVMNYSGMKHRRIILEIPLVLSSTKQQVLTVRDRLRAYHLSSGDFDVADDAPNYIFASEFKRSSVGVYFYARTNGPDYSNYLEVKERLALTILEIVNDAGTSLAYPTQTILLDGGAEEPKPDLRGGERS